MKREIKFRGKRKENESWAIGSLTITIGGIYYIVSTFNAGVKYEVYPETVGQYIGLKDKGENRIYEGDIVDKWSDGKELIEIEFENAIYLMQEAVLSDSCTIVGNIYDNPELMQK